MSHCSRVYIYIIIIRKWNADSQIYYRGQLDILPDRANRSPGVEPSDLLDLR